MPKKAMNIFKGISGKLIYLFLAVTITAILIIGIISYINIRSVIYKISFNQLESSVQIKKENLQSYFKTRENDITMLASTRASRQAIKEFSTAFNFGVNSRQFKNVENKLRNILIHNVKTLKYYDAFYIRLDGTIVYTLMKEKDFGTNLLTEKYAGSNLAKAFKGCIKSKNHFLSDIERYEPSNNMPSMFLAYPIKENGKIIGVFALQIPLEHINEIMLQSQGLGKTGETFVVGTDYYFRSPTRNYKKLGEENVTLKKQASSEAVKRGLLKQKGELVIMGYRGVEVLSSYNYVDLDEFHWAIIGQIDVSEAINPVYTLLTVIIIISLIIIGVVILIAVLIGRSLTKPILAGVKFAESIAANDLTKKINNKYLDKNDEIGQLAKSLNKMQVNLITIVRDMIDIATMLGASSEENSASAQNLADNSQTQAASIEETSASMEELNSTMVNVAENAENVNNKAEGLLLIAQESKELVESAIVSMDKISESSKMISEILSVINDIADQTNLLALNAAIEAARAGEHGRGFAVVADEISKLADKSSVNSKEIEKLIKQSLKDIENGTTIVKNAGDAFKEIINGVNKNSEFVNEIVENVNQQKAGAEQVQKAVEEINEITQSTSASAEEMAASTEELRNQAERIQSLFDKFIIPNKIEETKEKAVTIMKTINKKNINNQKTTNKSLENKTNTIKKNVNKIPSLSTEKDGIVKWDESYSVNVGKLDDQHKKWLGYINELHKAMSEGKSKLVIEDILKAMLEYTSTHLDTEEYMLKSNDYPEFEQHKEIHEKFVKWVNDVYNKFKENDNINVSLEVMQKIKDWLINHIKTVDQKYSDFLNEKGIR